MHLIAESADVLCVKDYHLAKIWVKTKWVCFWDTASLYL